MEFRCSTRRTKLRIVGAGLFFVEEGSGGGSARIDDEAVGAAVEEDEGEES